MSLFLSQLCNFSSVVIPWHPNPPKRTMEDIELMPIRPAQRPRRLSVKMPPTQLIEAITHAETNPRKIQNALRLIRSGPLDLDGTDSLGQTPVYLAVKGRHPDLVKALIQHQADLNKASVFKRTPLHAAASQSTPDLTNTLLQGGARASIKHKDCLDRTPLHYATWHGSSKTVAILLAEGAEPNERDSTGSTPLDYTLRDMDLESPLLPNQLQTIKQLLRYGAKDGQALAPENPSGKPDTETVEKLSGLLAYACDQPHQDLELIELLLQQPRVLHPHEAQHPNEEPADTPSYKNYRKAVISIARRKKIFPFDRDIPMKKAASASSRTHQSHSILPGESSGSLSHTD